MIGATHTVAMERPQLGFVDRAAAWLAIGLVAWILFEFGWRVARPMDPQAPLSLLSSGISFFSVFQLGIVAIGCAMLATLIAGGRLADVGPFAAGAGLVLLSLRGDSAEYFHLERTATSLVGGPGNTGLAWGFLFESLFWIAVLGVSIILSGWLTSRIHAPCEMPDDEEAVFPPLRPAMTDMPTGGHDLKAGLPASGVTGGERRGSSALTGPTRAGIARFNPATPVVLGVTHAAIVVVASQLGFRLLAIGSSYRAIENSQAVFTVAASVCIACYFAFHFAPARTAFWPVVGVVVSILIAYLLAVVQPASPVLPPTIPSSPFLRVLPIQFVAVGVATAVAMTWWMYGFPQREGQRAQRAGA